MQANPSLTTAPAMPPETSGSPLRFVTSLFEPHVSVTTTDMRRRVRLFLAISLLSAAALIVSLILIGMTIDARESREMAAYALPSTLGLILALPAYLLGRTRHYAAGAALMVGAAAFVAYGAFIVTPGDSAFNYTSTLLIALLFAGLFLGGRGTAVSSALIALGLIITLTIRKDVGSAILGSSVPYLEAEVFSNAVAVLNVVTMGIAMVIFIRLRDLLEADRRKERERALEQERLAEDFKRADQLKSAFLASMSHELRTPLNAVINYTKFVANGTLGEINNDQKEVLEASAESAEHLLQLINDVLDMSKIEAGSLRLFIEPNIDLSRILDNVIVTGKALVTDKPVTFSLSIESDLPRLRIDRQRVTQILLNIMSNACKFTDEGEISLRAWSEGDEVIIALKDNGPGIAKEDHDLVFTAFKQTMTGLRKGGGTGLGMPISRSLAEAHGGRLWLESTPGHGATFFVALPKAVPEAAHHH